MLADLKPGQKAGVFPVLMDMSCGWREKEVYGMCSKWGFLDYRGYGSGMAEYIYVDNRAIH